MKRIFALILAFAVLLPGLALAEGETPPASPVAEPAPDTEPTSFLPPTPTPVPTPTPTPVVDQLIIDSDTLYNGMDKTYQQGYVPRIFNGRVYIILPLLGKTYDGKVTVTADLGATANSPFVFGNYSQTVGAGWGAYVFLMEIPLISERINGSYPVTLKADYLDVLGNQTQQTFTVYVTVTDGKNPPDPNAQPPKEAVEKPELFISACAVNPHTVGGEEEFTVHLTIENIGAIRARRCAFPTAVKRRGSSLWKPMPPCTFRISPARTARKPPLCCAPQRMCLRGISPSTSRWTMLTCTAGYTAAPAHF